jgi:hypothetical protein
MPGYYSPQRHRDTERKARRHSEITEVTEITEASATVNSGLGGAGFGLRGASAPPDRNCIAHPVPESCKETVPFQPFHPSVLSATSVFSKSFLVLSVSLCLCGELSLEVIL